MYLIVKKTKHGNANVWILILSWVLAQCSLVNANWKIILKSMKKIPFNTALKKVYHDVRLKASIYYVYCVPKLHISCLRFSKPTI